MGGGVATYLTEVMEFEEDDKKVIVLAGMAGAIGALFPTPLLSIMMMFELGLPPRPLMESVTVIGVASISAFAVNYSLIGFTFQEYFNHDIGKVHSPQCLCYRCYYMQYRCFRGTTSTILMSSGRRLLCTAVTPFPS